MQTIKQLMIRKKQLLLWNAPIKNPHQCHHSNKELRKQTHGAFVLQCPECGSTASTSLAHKTLTQQQMDEALPFDYARRQLGWDFSSECREVERVHGIKSTDSILAVGYDEYLRSYEWKLKRQLIIDREKNLCQGCRSHPIEEVHHATYSNVGDELLFQLVGLCSSCHRKVHKIQ